MASSLPPDRYVKPGVYIDIVRAAQQVYQRDLRPLDVFFDQILAPFARCLVDGDPLDPDHPLYRWIRQHTARFQVLRLLCREIMAEEPDCFTSERNFRVKWRGVRARMHSIYEPMVTSGSFDELLDQTEAVCMWRSGLTLKLGQPELSVRGLDLGGAPTLPTPREDPRKYCIQPDFLVVDSGPEYSGVETMLSTVPAIPLDLEDEED
jgi:hypothetical protein